MKSNSKTYNTHLLWAATLTIPALLAGCSGNSEPESEPSSPQPEELWGIWERTGYGDVFVIDGSGADSFEYNRMGCVEIERLSNSDIAAVFSEPQLAADGASMIASVTDNLPFDTYFERLGALPIFGTHSTTTMLSLASGVWIGMLSMPK